MDILKSEIKRFSLTGNELREMTIREKSEEGDQVKLKVEFAWPVHNDITKAVIFLTKDSYKYLEEFRKNHPKKKSRLEKIKLKIQGYDANIAQEKKE